MACSPDWSERREFATLDEQNNLQLWDVDRGHAIKGHKGHVYKLHRGDSRGGQSNEVTSAICFTQTEKIISCEHSVMIVYCLVTDTFKIFGDFFKSNFTVVLISPCPTDRDIFAVGMKNGLIQLISLRNMSIIWSMRGHDKEIVSIDWMQIRVKPEQPSIQTNQANWRQEERPKKEARKKNGSKTRGSKFLMSLSYVTNSFNGLIHPEPADTPAVADNSDIFDIYDYNENEEEFGTIIDRESSSYDQRDRFRDKVHATEGFNFLEECRTFKEDLIIARQQQEEDTEDAADDAEKPHEINTDDENELDEAEKFRDFIIVDDEGKEGAAAAKDEEEEGDLKMILVTGSRENVIFFWNHESGVAVDKIMLASNQSSKRLCPGIFITAAWVNPSKIVANNVLGHVYEWDLSFFYRASQIK